LIISLLTAASRPALKPTQPPIQWVPAALSLEAKRPGREADHSLPSSAELKNSWSYTSTLPIHVHGVVFSYSTGTTFTFYLPKIFIVLALFLDSLCYYIIPYNLFRYVGI
jgi:hypothetical protein